MGRDMAAMSQVPLSSPLAPLPLPDSDTVTFTVGVAAIILTSRGLLLGRRQGGGWCIPCGHVEWHESIQEAIAREMREELGVNLDIGSIYNAHSNFHNPHQHTVGIWFLAKLPEQGEIVPGGDLVEVGFFPLDEIPELVFPTDRLIVKQLRLTNPPDHPA